MTLGFSVFLLAVGAILKYAVTWEAEGVDVQTVGTILMIAGAIGLLISLFWMMSRRRTDVIHHDRGTTVVEPADPAERF